MPFLILRSAESRKGKGPSNIAYLPLNCDPLLITSYASLCMVVVMCCKLYSLGLGVHVTKLDWIQQNIVQLDFQRERSFPFLFLKNRT